MTDTDQRLDVLRGEVVVELHILAGLLEIAWRFADLAIDDELARTLGMMRDHLRRALELGGRLQRERAQAVAAGEAAQEWRAQRDGRASA